MKQLHELITIIIPCKDEKYNIAKCIHSISNQLNIHNTKIIIADSSTTHYSKCILDKLPHKYKNTLNISIIDGGYPSEARLNASKLVTTPFILFLDADMELYDKSVIQDCIILNKDLVTVPINTDKHYNWIFRFFDWNQMMSIKFGIPFAVGAFQLWNTEYYWSLGGYDKDHIFAEDFALTKKSKTMYIHKTNGVYTSPRRFQSKGVFYMIRVFLLSFINRNNDEFFKKHHNYWN